jgi:hypothetical protein
MIPESQDTDFEDGLDLVAAYDEDEII